MSNSVAQSSAESLCRFIKCHLNHTSPKLAALLIYCQRLSLGAFTLHVRRRGAVAALGDLFITPLGETAWNTPLLGSSSAIHAAEFREALEDCLPLTMSSDTQTLFVEELSRLHHSTLSADDVVFAFEYFSDGEHRQREGSFFTDKENARRLLAPLHHQDVRFGEASGQPLTIERIVNWRFLDPACGAGSVLIEAKRMVAELLKSLSDIGDQLAPLNAASGGGGGGVAAVAVRHAPRIKSENFVGIEQDRVAALCAEMAMRLVDLELDAKPAPQCIVTANAVTTNWFALDVGGAGRTRAAAPFDFIVGNPPFLGGSNLSGRQRDDMRQCWGHMLRPEMDYVSCWFKKAADYIDVHRMSRCAFISTDSVTQGAQLSAIWPYLLRSVRISFAYESVRWNPRMLVSVVIIGLCHVSAPLIPVLFFRAVRSDNGTHNSASADDDNDNENENGNTAAPAVRFEKTTTRCPLAPHLQPNVPFVDIGSRRRNISGDAPPIHTGCMLQDSSDFAGFLMTREQVVATLAVAPEAATYIRPHATARHTMAGTEVYCIDLETAGGGGGGAERVPSVFRERIEHIRESRDESASADIRRQAATPHRWTTRHIPRPGVLLVLPVTSGKNYCVFPIARIDTRSRYLANNASLVCSATTMYIETDSLYAFGVLQSSMHRAWVYALCGTNGPSTRYNTQLYKSFVWPPAPSADVRLLVEQAARAIVEYRTYKETAPADEDERDDDERRKSRPGSPHALYCRERIAEPLATLHAELDSAVETAYGLSAAAGGTDSAAAALDDAARFAFLADLFERATALEMGGGAKKRQTTIGEMLSPKRARAP